VTEPDQASRSAAVKQRLVEAIGLKQVERAGWLRVGIEHPESVAAHSWGVAWLVLALCPRGLDRGRALAIALLHDLAEVRTGDITPHDGVPRDEKRRREQGAMGELLQPFDHGDELMALWREYEDRSTPEGRFVRTCDKLDMALTAQRYAASGADTQEFVHSALAALDGDELAALIE
jgi:putative hydrolase of HD superfamily